MRNGQSSRGILARLRSSKIFKGLCIWVALQMLMTAVYPMSSFALTSGPDQPEASSFQQVDMSNMVDPFTGDFSYNIPLLEVGGYPINLSYASGITMDQEASWAGLGWNVNTGAISRSMRGLPDDFWGEEVVREFNVKPNKTYGINLGLGFELFGLDFLSGSLNLGLDFSHNNYTGFNMGTSVSPGISVGKPGGLKGNVGLGLSSSVQGGASISPNISFSGKLGDAGNKELSGSLGFGMSINSRTGLSALTLNGGVSATQKATKTKTLKIHGMKFKYKDAANRSAGSAGFGGSISFGLPSYTPQIDLPFKNLALSFRAKVGIGIFGGDGDLTIGGFYSGQTLREKMLKSPAYGYLFSHAGQKQNDALLDFNREKDASFTPNTPNLPVTNFTYDVYQINAQGIGGSFRPFRDDVGYVFDKEAYHPSADGSLGFEIGPTQVIDVGLDVNVTQVNSTSHVWEASNMASNTLGFRNKPINTPDENVYFKLTGEMNTDQDPAFFQKMGGNKPVAINLSWTGGMNVLAENKFRDKNQQLQTIAGPINRNGRVTRTTNIECLTVAEVRRMYPHRAICIPTYAPDHHIAQITVVKADGTRYVFGLPAYNHTQKEITFAVGIGWENSVPPSGPGSLVNYGPTDNGLTNEKGIDNRYDATTMPRFVHTWYLTEVLSPDYVDVTGDGPSEDDLGTYTYFRYGNDPNNNGYRTPDVPLYRWRTPTTNTPFQATHNEGLKSDRTDDVANIVYGEKEIWYLHSIESKNQVAVFELSARNDGYGVNGVNGSVGGAAQMKIDRIDLYAKEDYVANYIASPGLLRPIKSVHFEYNYDLCQGVPNNPAPNTTPADLGGKLTLRRVYFTYEKSGRAKFSGYEFDYATNPDYDMERYDRWGFYRDPEMAMTNADYPYTVQDRATQDINSECWALSSITLPSGGNINIEYESDDYAYVQDKQAGLMVKVVGASKTYNGMMTPELFSNTNGFPSNLYIFFRLKDDLDGAMLQADADNYIKNKYILGNGQNLKGPDKFLYFRFLLNADNGTNASKFEYVSGYAEIDQAVQYAGATKSFGSSDYDLGWIKLKEVSVDESGSPYIHPIAKAGWQFSRINTPRLAFNQPDPTDSGLEAMMKTLAGADLISQIIELFKGPNKSMRDKGFASRFRPDQSWIRLLEPEGHKLGGGSRVKRISIADNWDVMTNSAEEAKTYAQLYHYDLPDGTSSGVAEWEPSFGADENIHRVPIYFENNHNVPLIPDDRFYLEAPMCESLFPAPSVGYSYVTVETEYPQDDPLYAGDPIITNATGKIVHEFYTAKDFPTKVSQTPMIKIPAKTDPLFSLFKISIKDYMNVSQGYMIELNDMHGKPKAQWVYAEGKTDPLSGSRNIYNITDGALDNEVRVINEDGSTELKEIGIEYDFVADFRENDTETHCYGGQGNLATFLIGPIPILLPTIFPNFNYERTRFRSAVTTKVVRRSGIQIATEAYDLGARVKTENIAFDNRTGDVLVTRVNNQYDDERYAVTYPSHWVYDRMGFAAENWGIEFSTKTPGGSYINWDRATGQLTDQAAQYLVSGDELYMTNAFGRGAFNFSGLNGSANTQRLWVLEDSNGDKWLIDHYGNLLIQPGLTSQMHMKVIRSGRRNMPNVGVGMVETTASPFVADDLSINNSEILNTSAQEYREIWRNANFLPFSTINTTQHCYPNTVGYAFVALLNNLLADGKLVTGDDVNLTTDYPDILDEIYGDHPCELHYSAFNGPDYVYTPVSELDNNAYIDFDFGWIGAAEECEEGLPCVGEHMVCLTANPDFTYADFNNIVNFDYPVVISAFTPLEYFIYNTYVDTPGSPFFMVRGEMADGSYHYFLIEMDPDCLDIQFICDEITTITECNLAIVDPVNPFLYGILGNWRPRKSYTYLAERSPSTISAPVNLRTDGKFTFTEFFWQYVTNHWEPTADIAEDKWRWVTEITNYSPYGFEVENKDALENYSAAVYGYKNTLPVMVAQNAKYKEIACDNFEDYYPSLTWTACSKHHFKFESYKANITTVDAHTGIYSMMIPETSSVTTNRDITPPAADKTTITAPYSLTAEDFLGLFSPDENVEKDYIISFWVKSNMYIPFYYDYPAVDADILINGTPLTLTNLKKSEMIEGWQQFEYEFQVPNTATSDIEVTINNNTASDKYYLDDIRIFPKDATTKTFVYNALTLEYMAELDENNYATFYDYDEDGSLVRIRKETERGIMTIQETRNKTVKRNF